MATETPPYEPVRPANPAGQVAAPTGVVTFLFTDIEGSTQLWERFPDSGEHGVMRRALARHDAVLLEAVASNRGYVFKRIGDAFCAAFNEPADAARAILDAQRALYAEPWGDVGAIRARAALHTGPSEFRDNDYFGRTLGRVSRLLNAGHGGQTILSAAAAQQVAGHLPKGVELKPLGRHVLKDLLEELEVFQLLAPGLPEHFPALRSLNQLRRRFPYHLPVQTAPFVGRVKQIDEVVRLLASHRHVTLTGFAGSGKTRLSLQVASEVLGGYEGPPKIAAAPDDATGTANAGGLVKGARKGAGRPKRAAPAATAPLGFDFTELVDGVWFVDLQPLADPALVPSKVAEVVRVQERPGKTITQALNDYLRPKKLLLVLNNCEHMAPACAELVRSILESCPEVRLLATSRERLRVPGEQVYRVPSMQVPDPGPSNNS